MKTITTTNARKNLARLVDQVNRDQIPFGLGRRNRPEVLVIPYPTELNPDLNTISNFNANSSSFDFLKSEPELYHLSDLKRRYV